MTDEKNNNRGEIYDIGVSSGLIRATAEGFPQAKRRSSEAFSSFQVELPSRRWLKLAASGKSPPQAS